MNNLNKLAENLGFLSSYTNCFGEEVSNSPEALQTLVSALGYDTGSESSLAEANDKLIKQPWLTVLPETIVVGCETDYREVIFSYTKLYTMVVKQTSSLNTHRHMRI